MADTKISQLPEALPLTGDELSPVVQTVLTFPVTAKTTAQNIANRSLFSILTGFVSGAGPVSATDTILTALQKIVGNIASIFTVNNVTASRALTGADNRALLSNTGAGAEVNYTAPTGLQSPAFACQIANVDSDGSKFTVPAGAVVYFGGQVSSDGGSISTTTIGAVLNVAQVSATVWIVTGATGDWTIS